MDSANILTLEIAKLVLKPGDILVVRLQQLPNTAECVRLQTQLQAMLPKGVEALVTDSETELTVISANG